jgi:hypothetical protein
VVVEVVVEEVAVAEVTVAGIVVEEAAVSEVAGAESGMEEPVCELVGAVSFVVIGPGVLTAERSARASVEGVSDRRSAIYNQAIATAAKQSTTAGISNLRSLRRTLRRVFLRSTPVSIIAEPAR